MYACDACGKEFDIPLAVKIAFDGQRKKERADVCPYCLCDIFSDTCDLDLDIKEKK